MMRAAAIGALVVGAVLLLGSWDGLYDALDLPQGLPALTTQMGGASLVALAYLLWAASAAPPLQRVAALTGVIAEGGAALLIVAWLVFRDPEADLGIDTLGTAILVVVAAVFALLAIGLARVALAARRSAR